MNVRPTAAIGCIVGALLASSPVHGCKTCLAKGCRTEAELEFANPLHEDGTYTFQVIVDGKSHNCVATIPFLSPSECDREISVEYTSTEGDAGQFVLVPPIRGVRIYGQPERISLLVSREGREVLRTMVTTEFKNVDNGCVICPEYRRVVP